jgi:hypothetical protein
MTRSFDFSGRVLVADFRVKKNVDEISGAGATANTGVLRCAQDDGEEQSTAIAKARNAAAEVTA